FVVFVLSDLNNKKAAFLGTAKTVGGSAHVTRQDQKHKANKGRESDATALVKMRFPRNIGSPIAPLKEPMIESPHKKAQAEAAVHQVGPHSKSYRGPCIVDLNHSGSSAGLSLISLSTRRSSSPEPSTLRRRL